jgi:hypothetical protein
MTFVDKDILFERVCEQYQAQITDETFNGIKLQEVDEGFDNATLCAAVTTLVTERKIEVLSSKVDINTHIKRRRALPIEKQLRYLDVSERYHTCLYPTPEIIEHQYDLTFLDTKPFTKEIARGAAQLESCFFEIGVIDRYRLDPRYDFVFSEYAGRISITDPHYSSSQTPERDKISLQTFGLGMNDAHDPLVCVFLRYLSDMTPEHQQHWQTFRYTKPALMHENYYKPSILGEVYENTSGIAALRLSVQAINRICREVWGAPLFVNEVPENVHYNLSPFMRSSKSDYHSFTHELDKLLADNISQKFFDGKLQLYSLVEHDDGTVERKAKGTLSLLDEWLFAGWIEWPDVQEAREQIIAPLRKVRRERQSSAHSIIKNEFDMKYQTMRREILSDVAFALGNIVMTVRKHPQAPSIQIPKWFEDSQIEII